MRAYPIDGLSEVAKRYDAFLLDQYGVLHDGERLYRDAANAVSRLTEAGKTVVVMTNSGKRSATNLRRLRSMGLYLQFSQVVSSGEVAHQGIASGKFAEPFRRGRRAFIVGKRGDEYGFDDLDLEFSAAPENSDFLLILGTNVPEWDIGRYRIFLNSAAKGKIPALCCNPDLDMLTPSGVHPAPGAIGQIYEELGGGVTYIGKPERAIYDYAIAVAGDPGRDRTIAIGDSITHDVVGARRSGIDVALVRTGLSASLSDEEIAIQGEASKVAPDWILPSLIW